MDASIKSTVGVDSVWLRLSGINKNDIDRFCSRWKLAYGDNKKWKYTRTWKIFLAGGHPISAVYHFSSKTTTLEVGGIMNYSTTLSDKHKLLQQIMSEFSDRKISVARLDISVDIKEPLSKLTISSKVDLHSLKTVNTTLYHNRKNGSVLCIYDKAVQMQIYSTSLTRFELRLNNQLRNWKVEDVLDSSASLDKLALKIQNDFKENIEVSLLDGRSIVHLDTTSIAKVLENFVTFMRGDTNLKFKDHFKISNALTGRDKFKEWMLQNNIKSAEKIDLFVKGRKASCLKGLGLNHETFNKAVKFYKGIPNFKVK